MRSGGDIIIAVKLKSAVAACSRDFFICPTGELRLASGSSLHSTVKGAPTPTGERIKQMLIALPINGFDISMIVL
jgi:hypothetical protein